jgi:hypothetical protein
MAAFAGVYSSEATAERNPDDGSERRCHFPRPWSRSEERISVSARSFSRNRPRRVNRLISSGFEGLEVAREGDCARVPDGPQGGLP